MKRLSRIFLGWLPLAAALTLVFLAIYSTAQQVLRMGADYPQVQIAEDTAARLAAGADARQEVDGQAGGAAPVEISSSLSPYLIVFDAQNKPIASGAQLHGQVPEVPAGVLDAARQKGENRVTWQPERGVRSATVETAVGDGRVVLAGRSLKEVERRVDDLGRMLLVGWLATLAVTALVSGVTGWLAAER